MSTIQVRKVNVVPITKIKIEQPESDDDADTVQCKVCSKSFVTEMAVNNHGRIEHIEQYLAGEQLAVRVQPEKKRKQTDDGQHPELVSVMQPASSRSPHDSSYIIIKKKDPQGGNMVKRARKTEKEKPAIIIAKPKEKVVKPISGPFECLEPAPHDPEAQCHQIFLSCCEYSTHFRDEHTRRRKGNRCQVCEKPLSGEQQAPYPCQVCGLGFENSKDLAVHGQTAHVKLKPFQCSICLKRFTQLGGLQQHTRMHTGDRPFECTYCSKAFTQKSGLDQHLRIHTKVRPYRCVVCGKSFCQSVHLQQHMRTHTNVAPFQCGICDKRFKQSSHLNYHLRYHNVANMTDEQKTKYAELIAQIIAQEASGKSNQQQSPQTKQKVLKHQNHNQGNDQTNLPQAPDYDQELMIEYNQSDLTQEEIDQSELTQEEISQSDLNQEYEQTELTQEEYDQSELRQEYDQSELTHEEYDQSELTQEEYDQSELRQEYDQSELTHEEYDQSELTQEEYDQSELTQEEIDQSESVELTGETVYILNEGEVWCEGVVCE